MKPNKIEISARTIIFTVFFILGLVLLWQIRDLIYSLFIAFILAGALRPMVEFLEKKRLPRLISSLFIYTLFIFVIYYIFALIIPPLASEMILLFNNLPKIIKLIAPKTGFVINFDFIAQNIPGLTNQTVEIIKGVFSNVIFLTSTLFFGFYFVLEKNLVKKLLGDFFDDLELNRIELVSERVQNRLSSWFWGEIVLMIVVGVMTFIGLNLIGMKYALALAVLAGLLEVVPNLGPITSAIPAVIIGLSLSPLLGIYNVFLYLIVQQLENNLIVPAIMKKVTGLHPITTLIVMIIGGKLAGIMGVLLAVPTTMFIQTILIEWQKTIKR